MCSAFSSEGVIQASSSGMKRKSLPLARLCIIRKAFIALEMSRMQRVLVWDGLRLSPRVVMESYVVEKSCETRDDGCDGHSGEGLMVKTALCCGILEESPRCIFVTKIN